MAKLKVKIEAVKAAFRCPECGDGLAQEADQTPDYVVCPHCAAIPYFDKQKLFYRMPKTEEWLAILAVVGYWDLLIERERIVAKLTEPAPQPAPDAHAKPPRAAPVRRK